MQNVITREITIQATQEAIYRAIADAEQVIKWFPEAIEGDYSVGQQPIFSFGDHGKNQVLIEEARPNDYFAYRWVPGANHFLGDVRSVPNTLVEFRISEETNGECTLTLTESGFAALPPEMIDSAFQQNSNGWEFMLGRLQTYL